MIDVPMDFTSIEQRATRTLHSLAEEDVHGGFPVDQMIVFTSKTSPTGRLPAMNTKYGHPYGKQSTRKEAV